MDKIEEIELRFEKMYKHVDEKFDKVFKLLKEKKEFDPRDKNKDGKIDFKDTLYGLFNNTTQFYERATKKIQTGSLISNLVMAGFCVVTLFL